MLPAERGETGARAFRPVFPLFLAGLMVALAAAAVLSFRTGEELTPFDRYVPERRRDP